MINVSSVKKKEDLEIIAEQYANYYNNSVLDENWTRETANQLFKYFYNQSKDLFFIAYDEDKPVSVIMSILKPWWDGMHLEDGEVFVCKEYQHRGIAKMLLKALFQHAIEKYDVTILEAHAYEDENGFPYCWYKRLGFDTIDNWKIISGNIRDIVKNL